jgi:hypothetical protein
MRGPGDGDGVLDHVPDLTAGDRVPRAGLDAHDLAVDLGEPDRDRGAHQPDRHDPGLGWVALDRHDERQADDRAVDDLGDLW